MTQTSNRILDEFAKMFGNAANAAQSVRNEVETLVRAQAERILNEFDLVQREEFEAVRDLAGKAREENELLKTRVAELEKAMEAGGTSGTRRTATRKSTASKTAGAETTGAKGARGKAAGTRTSRAKTAGAKTSGTKTSGTTGNGRRRRTTS